MLQNFLKSKIQGLKITSKELYYDGSLQLDQALLAAAGILPGEMVQVVNVNNGERFDTYVIAAPSGSGVCALKGAAARLGEVGDELIVMSMVYLAETEAANHRITKVRVDSSNRLVSQETESN